MAQMAATAGSVAVGSTIGHGLSNMLFGSSHPPAAPEAPAAPVQQQQASGLNCEIQAKGKQYVMARVHGADECSIYADFTKCLESADLPSCTWYLEQLKAVSNPGRLTYVLV